MEPSSGSPGPASAAPTDTRGSPPVSSFAHDAVTPGIRLEDVLGIVKDQVAEAIKAALPSSSAPPTRL